MVGFGKPETPYPVPCGQMWKIFFLLLVRSVGIYRVHDQAGLNTHHRPVTRINAFNFPGYKAITDIVKSRTTVTLYGRSKHSQLTHLVKNVSIYSFLPIRFKNSRL